MLIEKQKEIQIARQNKSEEAKFYSYQEMKEIIDNEIGEICKLVELFDANKILNLKIVENNFKLYDIEDSNSGIALLIQYYSEESYLTFRIMNEDYSVDFQSKYETSFNYYETENKSIVWRYRENKNIFFKSKELFDREIKLFLLEIQKFDGKKFKEL